MCTRSRRKAVSAMTIKRPEVEWRAIIVLIGLLFTGEWHSQATAQFVPEPVNTENQYEYNERFRSIYRYFNITKSENGVTVSRSLVPCRLRNGDSACLLERWVAGDKSGVLGHPDWKVSGDGTLRHFSAQHDGPYLGYSRSKENGPRALLVSKPTEGFGMKWRVQIAKNDQGAAAGAYRVVMSGDYEGWYLDFEKTDEMKQEVDPNIIGVVEPPLVYKAKLSEKPGPLSTLFSVPHPKYKQLR